MLDRYNNLKLERLSRILMEEEVDPESNLATHFESGKWTSDSCVAAILDGNLGVLKILYEHGIELTEKCYVEAARMGNVKILEYISKMKK